MIRRRQLLATMLAAPFVASSPLSALGRPVNVVTTTGMIADAVRQVGGNMVNVKSLMGPGVDPHAYRQTRSDILALTRADLVLWHGLYLEAQMEELLLEMSERGSVIAVGEAVPEPKLISHEDYEDRFDPHVWMVPELWAYVVRKVASALSAASPDQREFFTANAGSHLIDIARLGEYSETVLNSVPEKARVLLSAHDAFGYFGERYGYEVVGIQGISTESEAGLDRISKLVDMLVERDIRAAFVESSVSDRNVKALIEGAAAKDHDVVIGGELFSDAMGEPGTYEGTYLGMIDHNATMIAAALGGDAPDRGMDGKLAAGS